MTDMAQNGQNTMNLIGHDNDFCFKDFSALVKAPSPLVFHSFRMLELLLRLPSVGGCWLELMIG